MSGPLDWDRLVHQTVQDTFGEAVTYRPRTGAPFTITGIFDQGWHLSDNPGGSLGMAPVHLTNSLPLLGVRLAEFPSPPEQGDSLSVRGRDYCVQEVRDDSHGHAHLVLNEGDVPTDPPVTLP